MGEWIDGSVNEDRRRWTARTEGGGGGENPKSEFERTRDRLLIPDICSFSVNVLLLQMVPLFSLVFDVVVVLLLFFSPG